MPAKEPCPHCKGTGKIKFSPVRALRMRAGLSQKEIAEKLGILQPTYSRLESGEGNTGLHATGLADLYGVSTDVILGRSPLPDPKSVRAIKAPPAARLEASKRRRAAVAKKNRGRK